ncbi:Prophage integrase IntS [Methylobacterium crusticola]|uniref:Prophage integrase IntS n=1 Tax=Methylobacterium crusticola TaxID=1697972 RepID=A0ABQ4R4Q6_9HYPH|nr:site-specific integrase [Methylobacterium crusticola]GJD51769.1 Prophage integrase IntS [Methylobacterium crusticola]
MIAKVLTVPSVERLKPDPARRLEIPDAGMPSLYLIIHPSGRKGWCIRYRFAGRTRKMVLGPYPALDLATARSRARDAIQVLALGRDPGAEKIATIKAARVQNPDRELIYAVAEDFLDRHARTKNKASTAEQAARILRKEVVPVWGRRTVESITRRDVLDLLDGIMDRGTPSAANRTLATIRKFFNWCIERSIIATSPCTHVKTPGQETARDRVLTDEELRLVWLAAEKIGWPFGPLVKLLILTAQRRDEVAGIIRTEIRESGTLWHLPATRAKNRTASVIPLSEPAQAILRELPRIKGDYVLTTTGDKPVSGYSRAKRQIDAQIKLLNGADISHWTFHDLRRTAASGMARLGTDPHVVEAVLNHKSGTISGVAAVYNRYAYLDEKRASLEAWASHITKIIRVNAVNHEEYDHHGQ